MSKHTFNISESPVKAAVLLILVWAAIFNILYFTGEYVFDNFIFQGISFMIIYPVACFVMFYKYARNFGHKWYVYILTLVILLVEFISIKDVRAIIPNVIVSTVICLVFGGGIGGVFFDKNLAPVTEKKKEKDEGNYKKILDD